MGAPLPKNYLALEQLILKERTTRVPPVCTWEEFKAMASLCLIRDEQNLLNATALLHNLGTLVHFNFEKVFSLFSLSLLISSSSFKLISLFTTVA
jgi:hypothetical protein